MSPIQSFEPIIGASPCVLILGSMPSVASLKKQQYYGKPQNSFWRIMGALFSAGPDLAYEQRTARLIEAGVAVWDVLASCERAGSLDSAIDMRSVQVNNIADLLNANRRIGHVFFNGRKAEDIYRRHVIGSLPARAPELAYHCLPSTSPAMAALSFTDKLEQWRAVALAANTRLQVH